MSSSSKLFAFIGLGAAATVGLGYVIYNVLMKGSGPTTPKPQKPIYRDDIELPPQIKKQPVVEEHQEHHLSPQKHLAKVIGSIDKMFDQERQLDAESMTAIYKGQYELSRQKFKQIMKESRKSRRNSAHHENFDEYMHINGDAQEKIETLHNQNLNAILAGVKISKNYWMDFTMEYPQSGEDARQIWQNLVIDMDNQELDSLRNHSKHKIKVELLQEIYKKKVQTLKDVKLKKTFIDIDREIEAGLKYTLVEHFLEDKTFEEWKVEEEDLVYSYNELSEEQKGQIDDFKDQLSEIFDTIIYGDVEENEEEEKEKQEK